VFAVGVQAMMLVIAIRRENFFTFAREKNKVPNNSNSRCAQSTTLTNKNKQLSYKKNEKKKRNKYNENKIIMGLRSGTRGAPDRQV
jgi:hypothetical protein